MRIRLSLFLTLLLCPPALGQGTLVTGTLLGHDGTPMPQAHVVAWPDSGGAPLQSVAAGPDGHYRLRLPGPGLFALRFSGVHHRREEVPLLLDAPGGSLRLDVRLGTYRYRPSFDGAALTGSFNDFSARHGTIPLAKQPDGTYAAEVAVEADTLAYEVLNILENDNRGVHGTQADRYAFDGDGGYHAVVRVRDGRARVVFDPQALVTAAAEPSFTFGDHGAPAARFAAFSRAVEAHRRAYFEEYRALQTGGASEAALRGYSERYSWAPIDTLVVRALRAVEAPRFREVLLVKYLALSGKIDPALARQALDELAPSSAAWALEPAALTRAVRAAGGPERYGRYLDEALAAGHSDEVKAAVLYDRLGWATAAGDTASAGALYDSLTQAYAHTSYAGFARRLDPTRRIQVGRPVPAFALPALDAEGVTHSDEGLRGRTYLIDFWAVWCGPCLAEMPTLHAAYNRFKDQGFTILSLSLDEKPEDVSEYRRTGWSMPWLHAFLDEAVRREVMERFEVRGIPKPLLVGPDGTIRALDADLRGPRLEETLARVLGASDEEAPDIRAVIVGQPGDGQ